MAYSNPDAVAFKPTIYSAPKPVSTTSYAPKPTVPPTTMAPAPAGSTITRTASTIPSLYPTGGGTPGFQDIRSQLVNYQPSLLGQQASNQLSLAMSQAPGNANIPILGQVAGPNYGQANQYLSQAAQYAQGVNPGSIQAQNVGSQNVAGPDFSQAMSMLQQALASSSSPEAQQMRGKLMGLFDNLQTAPDRLDLAADALRIQRELTAPQWQQDLRHVGQQAAALGRIGSGMTTNELGDITLAREKALGLYGQQLANQASGQILQDRLNVFGAGAGLQGQFSGQDLAQGQFKAGLGNQYAGMAQATTANEQQNAARALQAALANQSANLQAATSRAGLGLQQAGLFSQLGGQSAGMATNTAQFNAQQQQAQQAALAQRAQLQQALLGQLAGIQGQTFNQGMSEAQLRTQQQQWQNQLQQQGVQNSVQQQVLQDQMLNSEFQRRLALAQTQGQYGFGNDPYSLLLAGSQYQQQNAGGQSAALQQLMQQQALAQQLAQQSAARGGAPTSGPMYGQQPGTYFYGS
jgi:hypothetical protein